MRIVRRYNAKMVIECSIGLGVALRKTNQRLLLELCELGTLASPEEIVNNVLNNCDMVDNLNLKMNLAFHSNTKYV